MMIEGQLTKTGLDQLLDANTFRPTLTAAVGIQDIWPLLLVICGTAFFADVFVRRVAITFDWVGDFGRYRQIEDDRPGDRATAGQHVAVCKVAKRKSKNRLNLDERPHKFEPVTDDKMSGKQKLEEVLGQRN